MMKLKKAYVPDARMKELQYVCYGDGVPHMMDTKVFRYWAIPCRDNLLQWRILRCRNEYITHLRSASPDYWKAHVEEVHSNRKRGK